jgi:uncharacterized membrane protein
MKAKILKLCYQPELLFLAIASFFGLILIFLTPPIQVADENAHFLRAYQVSQGNLMPDKLNSGIGGTLPTSVITATIEMSGNIPGHTENHANIQLLSKGMIPLNPSKLSAQNFEVSSVYPFVSYLPQALGIDVGRAFQAPPLVLLYLGRITNFIVWLLLVYTAIKLAPVGKWALATLALIPMSVFQAASLSADALTNGLAFLSVGLFLWLYQLKRGISTQELASVLVVTSVLSVTKPSYAIISFLFLLIPSTRFTRPSRYVRFAVILVVLNVGLSLAWAWVASRYLPDLARVIRPGMDISSGQQLRHVFTWPWGFAAALYNTYFTSLSDPILISFFGFFGWLDTKLPLWTITASYGFVAGALILSEGEPLNITRFKRLAVVAIIAGGIVLISLALYITFTPVGYPSVMGIQGRYFLPFVPLLILVLPRIKPVLDMKLSPRFVLAQAGILFATVLVLAQRYWGI